MAMQAAEIERLIKQSLPDAQVTIEDLAGDGDHYAAHVISASFKGKSRVQQHQMVYKALAGRMGGELHALALQTSAPENSQGGAPGGSPGGTPNAACGSTVDARRRARIGASRGRGIRTGEVYRPLPGPVNRGARAPRGARPPGVSPGRAQRPFSFQARA